MKTGVSLKLLWETQLCISKCRLKVNQTYSLSNFGKVTTLFSWWPYAPLHLNPTVNKDSIFGSNRTNYYNVLVIWKSLVAIKTVISDHRANNHVDLEPSNKKNDFSNVSDWASKRYFHQLIVHTSILVRIHQNFTDVRILMLYIFMLLFH